MPEIDWKHFKLLYLLYFAMNAEVQRTFTDDDFTILQAKNSTVPNAAKTFRLVPRSVAAKCDLRFSVWRGMLELLHLFNDAKTETRHLWECGLLLGLMEMKTVREMECFLDSRLTWLALLI
uniref:NR LBD domain-containing protein n=1 Tax=Globodera pallida TaxID=36090 RepID=A0A183CR28_GLOPA